MIILTSFNDRDIDRNLEHKVYSISDKQPNDLNFDVVKYDKLNVFVPSANLFGLSNEVFSERYFEELERKQVEIKKVIIDLLFTSDDSPVLLCCWCNENFKKKEDLFCHRVIVKKFMDQYFPYINVELRGF